MGIKERTKIIKAAVPPNNGQYYTRLEQGGASMWEYHEFPPFYGAGAGVEKQYRPFRRSYAVEMRGDKVVRWQRTDNNQE